MGPGSASRTAGWRPWPRLVVLGAAIGLFAAACGGASSSSSTGGQSSASGGASSSTATSATTTQCPPTGPLPGGSQLQLGLSGALCGQVTQVREPSTCTAAADVAAGKDFNVKFSSALAGQALRFEVDVISYPGPGTINLADLSLIEVSEPDAKRDWSNIVEGGSGSVTIAADRSGTVKVRLPERDYNSGAAVKGAPQLAVEGTWTCP